MTSKPQITLWFLNASRAVRIAWMLEALQLPYELVRAERASNGLAPPEFRQKIPGALRKSPTIQDGDLVVQESNAIIEHLCETYDKDHVFLPASGKDRVKVQEWINASEGTFMMHGIATMYARARLPQDLPNRAEVWKQMNSVMSGNIHNALNWLNSDLSQVHSNGAKYLVGGRLTAADIAMLFALQLIYDRKLGLEHLDDQGKGKWPEIEKWMDYLQQEKSWTDCVARTGFQMGGTL